MAEIRSTPSPSSCLTGAGRAYVRYAVVVTARIPFVDECEEQARQSAAEQMINFLTTRVVQRGKTDRQVLVPITPRGQAQPRGSHRYGRRPPTRPHERRVSDFVCAFLNEREYSFTTTVLIFYAVFFFDDWGRDEDPDGSGVNTAPKSVVTTKPLHRIRRITVCQLPRCDCCSRHRKPRKSYQPVVLCSARGTEFATSVLPARCQPSHPDTEELSSASETSALASRH